MKKKRKIQDFDFRYTLAKLYTGIFFRQYYRKIQVEGKENIPKGKKIILAPNHQNALMDAYAILETMPGQPVFLARADIFKQKHVAWILEGLNILPVYRIRDGRDELGKNSEIFEKAVDVLRDDVTLCLMPEGMQSFRRSLLPLVKGMFRIAFAAQEEFAENEVVIIPVGIDYDDYINPGGNMVIRFGIPILVSDYMQQYEENQAVALNSLRKNLSEKMSVLIQDIRSKEHYEAFYQISLITQSSVLQKSNIKKSPLSLLEARQKITRALDKPEQNHPEKMDTVCADHKEYQTGLSKFRLKDFVFGYPEKFITTLAKSVLLLLAFPLFLIGWIVNFIPSFVPRHIAGKLKTGDFKSSFRFVLQVVTYSLYYLLALILCSIFLHSVLLAMGIVVFSLILGRFSFFYQKWIKIIFNRFRFFFKKRNHKADIELLKEKRGAIIAAVLEMMD